MWHTIPHLPQVRLCFNRKNKTLGAIFKSKAMLKLIAENMKTMKALAGGMASEEAPAASDDAMQEEGPLDAGERDVKAKIEAGEGDAETKKALGDGYSVEKNFGEALTWYTAAAEAGSAEGAYELSLLYAHGKGTTQDKVMAKKWLILAAERGSTKAQLFIANLFTKGGGGFDVPSAASFE